MRMFELHRDEDESGVSGVGIVAQGVVFDTGQCALAWLTAHRSVAIYPNVEELAAVHGHNGRTRIVWTGEPFARGMDDCALDACENAPFASVGGLDKRGSMEAPAYVTPSERDSYLNGYRTRARLMYGEDWETCSFGWRPAIVIGGPDTETPRKEPA